MVSRGGFIAPRARSPEEKGVRSGRHRIEGRAPTDAAAHPAAENLTGEALYAAMCPSDGETLPPGWEKVVYHGTVVYLDHISREAHEIRPWEVWKRRSEAAS